MTHLLKILTLASFMLCASDLPAQDVDLTGVKCPVKGGPAKADVYVNYNYAVVYLCCAKCKAAFVEDMKLRSKGEYVARANHQLVVTGQYQQRACICGEGVPEKREFVSDVGGAEVAFFSAACKQKFDDAGGLAGKLEMAFAYSPFKKLFKKVESPFFQADLKCFMMPKKNVRSKYSVYHNGGTVFLCCSKCVRRYLRDSSEYVVSCNHQLVRTGQFEQRKCPISGGAMNPAVQVDVAGVVVKLADKAAKAKVEAAADDDAKAELLFSAEAFKVAFSKKATAKAAPAKRPAAAGRK